MDDIMRLSVDVMPKIIKAAEIGNKKKGVEKPCVPCVEKVWRAKVMSLLRSSGGEGRWILQLFLLWSY
jgi:hypothetical protein